MTTLNKYLGRSVFAISVLCMMSQFVNAQHQAEGTWQGYFMEDFKTLVKLECSEEDSHSGSIRMFDGMGEIQNDKLSKITMESTSLSFYIDAKETEFEGTFNEDFTELSGNFIFPDQSLHPIKLRKQKPGASEESASDWM